MGLLISISGASGVGKTTLAKLISYLYSESECFVISGDSFHRWERADKRWDSFTHFNPSANDLESAFSKIKILKNGGSVPICEYNHATGKFNNPEIKEGRRIIIYEGLHALYGDILDISDVKIFVDTNEDLTSQWKLNRDTYCRGYTTQQAYSQISRRTEDKSRYIDVQKDNADIIVRFKKNKSGDINIQLNAKKHASAISASIKKVFNDIKDFLHLGAHLAGDISLIQGSGGNISVKSCGSVFVKSSGSKIGDATITTGLSICELAEISQFSSELSYREAITNLTRSGARASMEAGFHIKFKEKFVVHTHPLYLNCLLCSTEGRSLSQTLFSDVDFSFVEYHTSGYELSNALLSVESPVILLENHGLIVRHNDYKKALRVTELINNRCKKWLESNKDLFISRPNLNSGGFLFPDAVVFGSELKFVSEFMLSIMSKCGLYPKWLNESEVLKLHDMESEKYRKENA